MVYETASKDSFVSIRKGREGFGIYNLGSQTKTHWLEITNGISITLIHFFKNQSGISHRVPWITRNTLNGKMAFLIECRSQNDECRI